VELSRRSVARALPFIAKGVTGVTVDFSDLLYFAGDMYYLICYSTFTNFSIQQFSMS